MRILFPYLLVAILFSGCNQHCFQYPVYGPDEFVIDSYKIREGKFSILEMEGIESDELCLDLTDTATDCPSKQVELIGEVEVPLVPIRENTQLFEVLSQARISSQANLFKSYVVRNQQVLPVDLYQLIHEGDMRQNIVMCGGDKIFIAKASDSRAIIMGEVAMPRAVDLPYGFLSLKEAIVAAGGILFTGNRDCIQVIRGNVPCPKIYLLSWQHITHLPNDSLLLMPGDTVYVSERPITQWNRFVSQLFPSLTGPLTTTIACRKEN